jgi:hypothetical protein
MPDMCHRRIVSMAKRETLKPPASGDAVGIVPVVKAEPLDGEICDRCTAAGRVLLTKGKLSLVVCGHHFGKHSLTLLADGWTVAADTRAALTAR